MSWSKRTPIPILKSNVEQYLSSWRLEPSDTGNPNAESMQHMAMADQFETAKEAARVLARTVPGPYVGIQLSGHANATGWDTPVGMSGDAISVSVWQSTQPS